MSRVSFIASSLLLVVGVVAALVRAQETGGRQPTGGWALPPLTAADRGQQVRLVQHLQNVGQSITAEYQEGVLLAASDPQTSGELRSILTRRSAGDGNQASDPGGANPPSQPVAAERTAAAGIQPLQPPAPGEPGLLQMEAPAAPGRPPATDSSAGSDGRPAEGYRTSSRRTFQSPEAGPTVPLVASKPVAAGVGPSGPSGAQSGSDTLSSTTGALLRVTTVGPSALTVGTTGQIAIRLSNLGSTDAQGAVVRIAIPQGLEMIAAEVDDGSTRMQRDATSATLIWSIDQVPARAERVLNLKAVPRSTEPLMLAVDWSVAPISSVAQIQIQEPRLELALRGPREIVYGQTKIFTVVVSNPGTGEARDVNLRLSLGEQSADTLQVGTIAAGASREFDVEVTARQAGPMQIAAAAVGAPELKAEAQEQVQIRRADLQIEALGSAAKYAGSVGTYQVRVTNAGDAPAEDVQAAVRLPMGAQYVQGLENATQEGADLKWPVGPLGPGQEQVYRFFCQLGDEGEARFEFHVRGNSDLQAAGIVLTQVQAIADLKMSVNDPKGPVPVGQEVVWEIQVTNRGTKAATQIQVIAQFSEGIEPAAAEGARAELVPGQVVFQPIARLNAGETIKLMVKAKADRDGNHLFRAELRCTDPEYRLVAEDTTTFYGDELMGSPVKPAETSAKAATPLRTSTAPKPLTNPPGAWTAK